MKAEKFIEWLHSPQYTSSEKDHRPILKKLKKLARKDPDLIDHAVSIHLKGPFGANDPLIAFLAYYSVWPTAILVEFMLRVHSAGYPATDNSHTFFKRMAGISAAQVTAKLSSFFCHPENKIRYQAIKVFERYANPGKSALITLEKSMDDDDVNVRCAVMECLAKWGKISDNSLISVANRCNSQLSASEYHGQTEGEIAFTSLIRLAVLDPEIIEKLRNQADPGCKQALKKLMGNSQLSGLPFAVIRLSQVTTLLFSGLPLDNKDSIDERFALQHEDHISKYLSEIKELSTAMSRPGPGYKTENKMPFQLHTVAASILNKLEKYWDAYQGDITIDGHGGSHNDRDKYLAEILQMLFDIHHTLQKYSKEQ